MYVIKLRVLVFFYIFLVIFCRFGSFITCILLLESRMNAKNTSSVQNLQNQCQHFDYDTSDLPRDFDIRIEVAEQREVLEQSLETA